MKVSVNIPTVECQVQSVQPQEVKIKTVASKKTYRLLLQHITISNILYKIDNIQHNSYHKIVLCTTEFNTTQPVLEQMLCKSSTLQR